MVMTAGSPQVLEIVDFIRTEYLRQLGVVNEYELLRHGFEAEMLATTIEQETTMTDMLGFGNDSGRDRPKAALVASTIGGTVTVVAFASNNKGGAKTLLARLLDRSEHNSECVAVEVHETNERAALFLEQSGFNVTSTIHLSETLGNTLRYEIELPVERLRLIEN